MYNISAHGLSIKVLSLQTFPLGFTLSQFSDDKAPLVISDDEVAGYEMTYDGDLFSYTKATPVTVTVSVIPGQSDDYNLRALLAAKRSANSLIGFNDATTMIISYPDGQKTVFAKGTIVSGPPADSVEGGRRKTNSYLFAFAAYNSNRSIAQFIPDALNILGRF